VWWLITILHKAIVKPQTNHVTTDSVLFTMALAGMMTKWLVLKHRTWRGVKNIFLTKIEIIIIVVAGNDVWHFVF